MVAAVGVTLHAQKAISGSNNPGLRLVNGGGTKVSLGVPTGMGTSSTGRQKLSVVGTIASIAGGFKFPQQSAFSMDGAGAYIDIVGHTTPANDNIIFRATNAANSRVLQNEREVSHAFSSFSCDVVHLFSAIRR